MEMTSNRDGFTSGGHSAKATLRPAAPTLWRVVRISTTTGRTLKVLQSGLTQREAELFAEGFGRDASQRTRISVELAR